MMTIWQYADNLAVSYVHTHGHTSERLDWVIVLVVNTIKTELVWFSRKHKNASVEHIIRRSFLGKYR